MLPTGAPVLVFVLALALASCSEPPPPPNVILISIDTLRADRLGAYGYGRGTSPALDALARRAVVFETAIAQAPWTAPSHASFLTSLYPSVLGMGEFAAPGRVADAVDTLAEAMARSGRKTAAFVAGGFVSPGLGFEQGFEVFDPGARTTDLGVDRAIAWIESLSRDEPFFMFLHTYDVHKYCPPPEWRERFVTPYEGRLRELPVDQIDDLVQHNDNRERAGALNPEDRRYVSDLYDACVGWTDAALGRLFARLDALGLSESTVIAVVSDHGEEFWEHGNTGHGYTLYDENLRVPFLLAGPSLSARRVAAQVRLIDVAPTLVALAGAAPSAQWQGEDLRSLIEGAPRRMPAFAEQAHLPYKAVRTPQWKYVLSLRRPHEMLFDLAADPGEKNNLLPARTAEAEELRTALERFMRTSLAEKSLRSREGAALDEAALDQIRELGYAGGLAPDEGQGDAARWFMVMARARTEAAGH